MKPFAAIYSTFLQRAYDQVVHDVAIQKLPVRFSDGDRAGFVGADGPTHCGAFDVTYLASLPGFVVMAAADEAELKHMVRNGPSNMTKGPLAFPRYPRAAMASASEMPERGKALEIGKGRILREGTKIALLSLGTRLGGLPGGGRGTGGCRPVDERFADARFAKPLDQDLVSRLAREHEVLITVEEGAIGGFATHVLHHLAHEGLLDQGLKVRPLVLPDAFTDHGKPEKMYAQAGLDRAGIVHAVFCRAGPDKRKPHRPERNRSIAFTGGNRASSPMSTAAPHPPPASTNFSWRGACFASRSRARDAILRGTVSVDGRAETKPGRTAAA